MGLCLRWHQCTFQMNDGLVLVTVVMVIGCLIHKVEKLLFSSMYIPISSALSVINTCQATRQLIKTFAIIQNNNHQIGISNVRVTSFGRLAQIGQ